MNQKRIRSRAGLVTGAAVLALMMATAAVAASQFTDVPDDHVFSADIEWMADNGITRGCNPPANDRFCPEDYVTRGQMSAFLHRFADAGLGGLKAFTCFSQVNRIEFMSPKLHSPKSLES